jgi:hypothetical protein
MSGRGSSEPKAQSTVHVERAEPITLACGHDARDSEVVVIMPSRKIRFDCPHGCGLQAAH